MKVIGGFTGTQSGMTSKQKNVFETLLALNNVAMFHHGDCVGADAEAHSIVLKHSVEVIIHPPINESKRAFCKGATLVLSAKEYLDRNHDIVNASSVLFATPKEDKEKIRSGTWATIRYAAKHGKKLFIILPNGEVLTSLPKGSK